MYASLLADDLRTDSATTVVTPLDADERHRTGLFVDAPETTSWPRCSDTVECGGHEPEWRHLLRRTTGGRFVLVANSPTPVDLGCLHSLRTAVAAASAGIRTTVIFQFVPDPCEVDISASTLAEVAEAQRWVCVSRHSRYLLSEATGVDPGCIHVVPNGVAEVVHRHSDQAARRDLDEELGLDDDASVLLTAARLVPSKRHEDALLAAAELVAEGRNIHLVWAGEGPAHEDLIAAAADAGMIANTHLLGQRRDIPKLLAAADIVVAPTVAEGLSFAVLEAMAAGKPIVAADATSNPELVVDGHTGLLAAPAEPMSYADRIRSLLDNPQLAARLGEAAQARQRALFTRAGMISGARKAIFSS